MMPYRSRRKRRRIKISVLLLLCCFCFVSPSFAQNNDKQSRRELEKKKKRINDEIRELSSQLSATKAVKKNSIGALLNINVKLKKRQELIRMINAEIILLDKDIERNQQQVTQLQGNLAKLKREYARMIMYSQRNQDAYTALMFIFAADNFNQAFSRIKYIQQYAEFRRKQAEEITNTQKALMGKVNELRTQQNEKQGLLGNEQVQQKNLSSEKKQQEQVLTELQQKEKNLKSQLEKRKEDAVLMQLAIKKMIEAEIRRKAEEGRKREEARQLAAAKIKEEKERKEQGKNSKQNTSNNKAVADVKPEKKEALVPELSDEAVALSAGFSNNRGRLPWPVTKGVICENYGEHEHPAIKGFMMFNNGIEICCSQGTQARAVFDGEVTGIALSPAGGKLVIIRHGEYLSVYSNLDQVTVKTGQKVSVKQNIGTVLFDGEEGKSSIGFQIWKEQKTMDPGGWLVNGR